VAVTAAGTDGAEDFADAAERYRRELQVYCYRMVGSFSEAEDLVQETLARAWRSRERTAGSVRAWLYKVATNLCIDLLRRRGRRRVLPFDVMDPVRGPGDVPGSGGDHLWVEPFPDRVLADQAGDPGDEVVHRETLELAFIAAVQYLPPKQRVVFIARDVMGWSAKATATLLDTSDAGVKSALQRARATIRKRLPGRREEWAGATEITEEEWAVVRRYIAAHQEGDIELADVLAEDVRIAYPAIPLWTDSRDAFIEATREQAPPGEIRLVASTASLQPAVAIYLCPPGEAAFQLVAFETLRVEDGRITEIVDFDPSGLSPKFGLQPIVSPDQVPAPASAPPPRLDAPGASSP
jgi:RNA polymerase sigma-70 factor, ECF subfamily